MWPTIYLVGFGTFSAAFLHAVLRRWYGKKTWLWIFVEYAWCGLSFIALILATIQLSDKVDLLETTRLEEQVRFDLVALRQHLDILVVGLESPEIVDKYIANNVGEEVRFRSLNRLGRVSAFLKQSTEASEFYVNLYKTMSEFCQNLPGKYKFTVDDPKKWYGQYFQYFSDEYPAPSVQFDTSAVLGCAKSFFISKEAAALSAIKLDRSLREPTYSIALSWSYILAFGIALKLTKTNSDRATIRRDSVKEAIGRLSDSNIKQRRTND